MFQMYLRCSLCSCCTESRRIGEGRVKRGPAASICTEALEQISPAISSGPWQASLSVVSWD